MELSLKRFHNTEHYTAGHLFLDGMRFMYTLEDQEREVKLQNETAIPCGRYRVILTYSPHFGRILPEVLNVPNFKYIRIHAGNKVEDTEGCILVGLYDGNDKDAWLGNSRKAEGILVAKITETINSGQETWLTVS